jgi:type I restriction enzyme S subunit
MINKIIFNEYKLSELVDIKGGKRLPKGSNLTSVKTNHPYVRVRDLNNKRLIEINDDIQYIDNQTFELVRNYKTFAKDILISIVGTVGLIGIVGKSLDGANLTENCVKLTNLRNIDHRYLYYFLISDFGKNEIMKGTVGAVQSKLPIKNISNIIIKLPSVNNQFKIASILSCFDDKIELNNKIIKNLEELAQTLYKRWFVDFEFPNEEGKPYKSSGGEMVESELGLIPKDWVIINLDGMFVFERGIEPGSKNYTTNSKADSIPFYRVGDLESRSNVYIDKLLTKDKFVDEKDVLVSFDGAIGRTGIGFVGSYSTGLRKVYDKSNKFKNSLIYFIMKSDSIQNTMKEHANGTTILHASTSIPYLKIAFKYEVLKGFELKIDSIFEEIITLKKQSKNLENLRDLLLPKLMTGEIEVPVME